MDILKSGLDELKIAYNDDILEKYRIYYEYLSEKNKVMNLTAISGWEDTVRLHFLDSLALLGYADFSGKKVIDIGSGAGFPGLPLKIACESMELTMLDALQKRVTFLGETIEKCGLTGAEAIHARAEEAAAKAMRDSFDYAVSRAVARLSVLTELCLPFVKPGGKFIAMKSTDTEEEINEAKNAVKTLGGKIEKVVDYTVPGTDVVHRAVIIAKVSPTPKGYPRRFAKISKEPL